MSLKKKIELFRLMIAAVLTDLSLWLRELAQ